MLEVYQRFFKNINLSRLILHNKLPNNHTKICNNKTVNTIPCKCIYHGQYCHKNYSNVFLDVIPVKQTTQV